MAETKKIKEETKVEEKIDNTPIDGQIDIEDTAELKVVEETADTLVAEMPDGEIVEIDKESIVKEEEIVEDKCADHISRTKILDVIKSTTARYNGKVVLAMEEVRDIINVITTAVQE